VVALWKRISKTVRRPERWWEYLIVGAGAGDVVAAATGVVRGAGAG
jgi:hypothetical protein